MSNSELLEQLRQLSDTEQVEIIQILTADLAKRKGLESLDNEVAYRLWSPYDYSDAAQKLMSVLEQEKKNKMQNSQRFPFIERRNKAGEANFFPCVPITLGYRDSVGEFWGLLDTGSSLNVLPYDVGLELGAVWEEQTLSIALAGNLSPVESRALAVVGQIGNFPPVPCLSTVRINRSRN